MSEVRDINWIHVALAVGNDVQRYGIERLLKALENVEILLYDSAVNAMDTYAADRFDVLIIPLRDGCTVVTAGEPKILLLLDSSNPAQLNEAADIECDGFLDTQELDSRTLRDALQRVSRGDVPIPSKLARQLLSNVRGNSTSSPPSGKVKLTPREAQVLALLVEGQSNKQVARHLGISTHSVKRLVASILAKLNCANRTLAVARAIQEGLCSGHSLGTPSNPVAPQRTAQYD